MKVAVLGGTGQLGSAVVTRLSADPRFDIRAFTFCLACFSLASLRPEIGKSLGCRIFTSWRIGVDLLAQKAYGIRKSVRVSELDDFQQRFNSGVRIPGRSL